MNASLVRGTHVAWLPRQQDLEPGLFVWKERGEAARGALGRPVTAWVMLPVRPAGASEAGEASDDAPERPDGPTARLEARAVPGVYVPASDALELLVELEQADRGTLPGDVAYFRELGLFVLGVLARGRILPVIEDGRPRWRPFFASDHDRRAVQALLQAMPHSLQVVASAGKEPLPPRPLRAVQREILDELTDGAARALLEGEARKAAKKAKTASDALLDALARGDDAPIADPAFAKTLALVLGTWKAQAHVVEGAFRTCFRLEPPVIAEARAKEDAVVERDSWKDVISSTLGSDEAREARRKKDERDRLLLPTAPEWTLAYFLQARDDPSALVPANEVWLARGAVGRFLGRDLTNPHERLLADLGRAARLFPPLEGSLQSPVPEKATLTTDEAYQFLREAAGAFEEAGFGVIVPSWWQKEKGGAKRLAARLKVQGGVVTDEGKSYMDQDSLMDFSWEVVLGEGGNALDRAELEALAALKTPLVKVRGEWVELRKQDLEAAMKLFQQKGPQVSMADAVEAALGASDDVLGLKVVGLDEARLPTGRFRDLLKDLRSDPKPVEPAKEFRGELRPYQKLGLAWLEIVCGNGMGALLADDMGLGKTIQVLAYLQKVKLKAEARARKAKDGKVAPKGEGPTLLLCPTSVLGNWRREAEKFTPELRVLLHHGNDRAKGKAFAAVAHRYDLILTSYGLALRDQAALVQIDWAGLILDEAQNLKNPEAKQTQAVRTFGARRRIALTGTPVENRLTDLHSIMSILNPGLLGQEEYFRERFAVPIERLRDDEARQKLRKLLRPFFLRREKTDPNVAPDLPKKIEMKDYCPLTPEQATLYRAVVEASLNDLKKRKAGLDRSGAVLGALTRLKQVCNHPAHFLKDGSPLPDRSGKLERLTELLNEVYGSNDKALVFTQFKEMGDLLVRHLTNELGEEPLFLHGGVSRTRREDMIREFSQQGGPRVFVLSLKAGGTGLNLVRACHVFHFDRWWNPAVEDQATDRAFRIGQTKGVVVHKLVCRGTLEERLDDMIEAKKALARGIVGAGEGWITDLSDEQLAELMSLKETAVSGEE